jgi:ABC-2 type transport system ATP-binding protein
MTKSTIIAVEQLTKFYGKIVGVRDLSFSVEPGEVFGFLGPNGAGKTTTIRLLMNLLRPDRGTISLFGNALQDNPVKLREKIGYLPGDFSPYGEMTGERFLHYLAQYRARPPVLRQRLLQMLNIDSPALAQKIKHLSHGNRQKFGIVAALEHEPDLAVLDEPSLGLDPLMQEAFYHILRELQQKGKTVFLSSHILPEVEKNCHRVAIIREGRLVALEAIENLKKKRHRRLIIELPLDLAESPPELPGTRLWQKDGNQCIYLVRSDIRPVLKKLAGLPLTDVIFPEPDLEDIFLAYYQEEEK